MLLLTDVCSTEMGYRERFPKGDEFMPKIHGLTKNQEDKPKGNQMSRNTVQNINKIEF